MSAWAITWLVILSVFIGVALWSFRRGRKEAERDQMEGILDDLEAAQGIERDVDALSRNELVDELRKPSR